MKKHFKSILSLCLAVMMLASLMTGCQEPEPEPEEVSVSIDEEKNLLLSHMKAYLENQDVITGQFLWVLDYVDAFVADNSWDSLLKARAACIAAQDYLSELTLPEFTLTDSQYDTLIDAGIEANVVKSQYLDISNSLQSDLNSLYLLNSTLHHDIFYASNMVGLKNWSEYHRTKLKDNAEYLCLFTNSMLIQLEMPGLWKKIPKKYPYIAEGQGEWCDDPEQLEKDTSDLLDRYEENLLKLNTTLGLSEYTKQLIEEALQTQNLEHLKAELNTVEDVPFYLPIPDWLLEDVDYHYLFTNSKTQEKDPISAGQEITEAPSALYVSCAGVSREDVELYLEQLDYWGYTAYEEWSEEDQTYTLFLMEGDSSAMIEWTEEKTIFYISGPVACLATELYLLTNFVA